MLDYHASGILSRGSAHVCCGSGVWAGGWLLAGESKLMKMRPFQVSDPKPQAEPALDQRQIVQAALGLLDEVGFDGLTMRSLAARLGIKAASLYWHVHSKQELLGLLAEEICAPMQEPDRMLPWQKQLELLGNEYRRGLFSPSRRGRGLATHGGRAGPKPSRRAPHLTPTLPP